MNHYYSILKVSTHVKVSCWTSYTFLVILGSAVNIFILLKYFVINHLKFYIVHTILIGNMQSQCTLPPYCFMPLLYLHAVAVVMAIVVFQCVHSCTNEYL